METDDKGVGLGQKFRLCDYAKLPMALHGNRFFRERNRCDLQTARASGLIARLSGFGLSQTAGVSQLTICGHQLGQHAQMKTGLHRLTDLII